MRTFAFAFCTLLLTLVFTLSAVYLFLVFIKLLEPTIYVSFFLLLLLLLLLMLSVQDEFVLSCILAGQLQLFFTETLACLLVIDRGVL